MGCRHLRFHGLLGRVLCDEAEGQVRAEAQEYDSSPSGQEDHTLLGHLRDKAGAKTAKAGESRMMCAEEPGT